MLANMHRRFLERELIVSPAAAAAANGSATPDAAQLNEASFDTNMVIILVALLCALICALGLNSIVRCALRCSHRFAMESPEQAAATGLKKRDLRQIPVAVYGEGVDIPATECPICLGEFVDGEKVRVLPKCNHGFHVGCIDMWLLSHSSCPICRHSLINNERSITAASSSVSEEHASSPAPGSGSGQQSNGVVVVINEAST